MGAGGKLSPEGGHVESMPGFEGHYLDVDGYTLGFETIDEAMDATPFYKGLPDDLCQSHHWGYVISGQMIMHRPEGDIVVGEGEAYYVAPGHTGESGRPGTKVIEFSPTTEYQQTMEVVAKNMEAMG